MLKFYISFRSNPYILESPNARFNFQNLAFCEIAWILTLYDVSKCFLLKL